MKRLLCSIIAVLLFSFGFYCFAVETTYVYAPDGRAELIETTDLEAWLAVGWYAERVVTVYAIDGRSLVVNEKVRTLLRLKLFE